MYLVFPLCILSPILFFFSLLSCSSISVILFVVNGRLKRRQLHCLPSLCCSRQVDCAGKNLQLTDGSYRTYKIFASTFFPLGTFCEGQREQRSDWMQHNPTHQKVQIGVLCFIMLLLQVVHYILGI